MQSKAFKILLPVGLVLIALVITVFMIKTKPHAQRQTPPTPKPRVTVYETKTQAASVNITGFGSVKAKRSVNITPQVSGEVIRKDACFEPGEYFVAGQLLLNIDDTDYLLAVARAKADVAQAEVNLARAEEEAQIARHEWASIGSQNLGGEGDKSEPTPLVLHEPQLKLAQASLAAARAALRQAEVNLGRCTISAPFEGRVLNAEVDAGQYLRAGNPIGTIYATDIAEITVPVPDEDLAWITLDPDEGLTGQVKVTAEFAGANHVWHGRAVRLGGAVDSRSRLVPVVIEVEHPYEREGNRPPLVEGMFVEVTFQGPAPTSTTVIPRIALRPGNLVWVVDQLSELHIVDVTVARAGVVEALISGGLEPGLQVVTSNLQYVTEGMVVQVEGRDSEALEKTRSKMDGEK